MVHIGIEIHEVQSILDGSSLETLNNLLSSKPFRLVGVEVIGPEHRSPDGGCLCEHGPGLVRLAGRTQDDANVVFDCRHFGMESPNTLRSPDLRR